MKKVLSIILLLAAQPVFADPMKKEIDYLMNYISVSSCLFDRNGNEYSGVDAVEHIKKKYDYFKSKIDSAEKFIDLSAARSSMSKKPYQIKCAGEDVVTSKAWLLQELERYRTTSGKT
ncbi:hypothetical protein A9Q99_23790 [Gammaproteobacteria bacterium 45_16_T64]|nr:hypothetical protein A9Q99_23790 [Gammaproteobacteria bacterium 45_16_T64]